MNTYNKLYDQFEHGFYASITLGILMSSCIGGIAAMAVLENGTSFVQMFQLFVVVACSMTFNGAILSQQKPKTIYNALIVSVVINTLILIGNFAAI